MASLKEIKGRIASVNSTLKITSAMKMVSSAKLRKAQNAIGNMVPYQALMGRILRDLMEGDVVGGEARATFSDLSDGVYTSGREETRRVALVCFSSNASLCGAFNSNVAREANKVIAEYRSKGVEVVVFGVGKKISDTLRKAGYPSQGDYNAMASKPSYEAAADLGKLLSDGFVKGEWDKVEFIYNHFRNAASQPTVRETYLPLDVKAAMDSTISPRGDKGREELKETPSRKISDVQFIVEPDRLGQIDVLLPKVMLLKIYTVLLDSQAAEHAARTLAMQTATDNGEDLLAALTLEYNKGRQQKITNELLDLQGGSTE